ncbi:MAG: TonB-dependent receptor [Bryobacterales bacterium]|nr:TonB-dependent receptor [Bryobacterales bacterium]
MLAANWIHLQASLNRLLGRISGTVSDPSGAAVAGAKLTVRNTDMQATHVEKTDDRGFYVAENLSIGPYAVEADQPGFKRVSQSSISIYRSRSFSTSGRI